MQIGWVDYSSKEKNKILSILKVLGTQSSVDELGIGTVRDAFSNFFFPGISVQHTRAKYFVLIPYLFMDAENEAYNTRSEVLKKIHEKEDKLIKTLKDNSPVNTKGIIGTEKDTVKIKPSSIYWNGLRTIGILASPSLSITLACSNIYNRKLNKKNIGIKQEDKESAGDDKDVLNTGNAIFVPIKADYDYMKNASIDLTKKEAQYLFDHFTSTDNVKDSLMAYILKNPKKFMDMTNGEPKRLCDSIYEIEQNGLPQDLKEKVDLAKQFGEFIYGAHVLYNIIFADGCGCSSDAIDSMKEKYTEWLENYKNPDLERIIEISNCDDKVAKFLRDWDKACSEKDDKLARETIVKREKVVKPAKAKLNRPDRHIYINPIHYFRLDYRYSTAFTIMEDIIKGLNRTE